MIGSKLSESSSSAYIALEEHRKGLADATVPQLAWPMQPQVKFFERLYPLAHILLFSSMLSAVKPSTALESVSSSF
jgi:hypothetical protein